MTSPNPLLLLYQSPSIRGFVVVFLFCFLGSQGYSWIGRWLWRAQREEWLGALVELGQRAGVDFEEAAGLVMDSSPSAITLN